MATTFKDLTPGGTKFHCRSKRCPQTIFWKACVRRAYVDLINLKPYLVLYEQEFEQNNLQPSYQKLKTMVKRCMDQKVRARNFEARNERIVRQEYQRKPEAKGNLSASVGSKERCVENGKKYSQAQRNCQRNILLACGCLVSTNTILNETRGTEFVVDSGASMQMLSRKGLTSAELETS